MSTSTRNRFIETAYGIPVQVQTSLARQHDAAPFLARNPDLSDEAWNILWEDKTARHTQKALVARPLTAAQRELALANDMQDHMLSGLVYHNKLTKDEVLLFAAHVSGQDEWISAEVTSLIRELHGQDADVFHAFDDVTISVGERAAWLADLALTKMSDEEILTELSRLIRPRGGPGTDSHTTGAATLLLERRPHLLHRSLFELSTVPIPFLIAAAGSRHLDHELAQKRVLALLSADATDYDLVNQPGTAAAVFALAKNPRTRPSIIETLSAIEGNRSFKSLISKRFAQGSWFAAGPLDELADEALLELYVTRALRDHAEDINVLLCNPFISDDLRDCMDAALEDGNVKSPYGRPKAASRYRDAEPCSTELPRYKLENLRITEALARAPMALGRVITALISEDVFRWELFLSLLDDVPYDTPVLDVAEIVRRV